MKTRARSSAALDLGMRIDQGLQAGQVLQRRHGAGAAVVQGRCRTTGPVSVTIRDAGGRPARATACIAGHARGGRFTARLKGIPVGGPWTITLQCGDATVQVQDVLVGDLWLMAGQSNMEGCARLTAPAEPHPMIRCFSLARRWACAREPLHLLAESPDAVHGGQCLDPAAAARARATARRGGGVGLHVARLLLLRTGVPQGLIAMAHGGSSMAQWSPALRNRGGDSLYGSMLLSLRAVGQPLAGVLWYQGESEAMPGLVGSYARSMGRLVAAVRRDLGQPGLPWLTVQIGRFIIGGYRDANGWPDAGAWTRIQEQQRQLPQAISRLVVVPAVDLELDDLVHLSADAFSRLAARLAEAAGRVVYRDCHTRPPVAFQVASYRAAPDPRVVVRFSHVVGGLRSAGPVRGFLLSETEGRPFPAIRRVCLKGATAVLHLAAPAPPGLQIQYGGGFDPSCTLVDARDMAVPVFGPVAVAVMGCRRRNSQRG